LSLANDWLATWDATHLSLMFFLATSQAWQTTQGGLPSQNPKQQQLFSLVLFVVDAAGPELPFDWT